MQFLIIGFDGSDPEAPTRRKEAREAHMEALKELKERGHALFATALLSEEGQMSGSAVVVDFPDQPSLEAWLKNEPYITQDVWLNIKIFPCKVPPLFAAS